MKPIKPIKARWLLAVPPVLIVGLLARALRVQLTVPARRKYWQGQLAGTGPVIVALGDSLTQGIGSSEPATSWLGVFRERLEKCEGTRLRVDNRAVYGAKLADLVAKQLPLPADAALVTMCIGSNDAGRTPPAEFEAMLRTVCAQLPPGSLVGDLPMFHWGPRVGAAAELAQVVRTVVADHPHLILARVEYHTRLTTIGTDLAGDYFHPNDSGYRCIADAFLEITVGAKRMALISAE